MVLFNPNPRWPEQYFQVLAEVGIPERERPFYAHWVRQFFNRNPGRPRRAWGGSELAHFLQDLRQDPAMTEWQINQARDALVMYYEQFHGIALGDFSLLEKPPLVSVSTTPPTPIPPPRPVAPIQSVPSPTTTPAQRAVDWPAGDRAGHSHRAGITRTQRCEDHHDLDPCPEQGTAGGGESAGRSRMI